MSYKASQSSLENEAVNFIHLTPAEINKALRDLGVGIKVIENYFNELGEKLAIILENSDFRNAPEKILEEIQMVKVRRQYLAEVINMNNGEGAELRILSINKKRGGQELEQPKNVRKRPRPRIRIVKGNERNRGEKLPPMPTGAQMEWRKKVEDQIRQNQ